MSEHVGYIVEVKNLRPHTNADRLQIATFFGNDTCVSLDVKIGDKGIYIPIDIQLSQEFCDANHLCRKTKDGEPDTGYMDENKRNVKAIKLRGEKSDGIYLPLSALEAFMDISTLQIGDTIGEPLIRKYIPRGTKTAQGPREGNRTRKHKVPIAPLFAEHADTEQLVYHLGEFREGDLVEITLKIHGTSQRTGYLPVLKGYKSRFPLWDKLLKLDPNTLGKGVRKFYDQALAHATPIYEWDYVNGTRRTVLEGGWEDGGFYGSNEFRKQHAEQFYGKLHKGETVYYEVCGFTHTGAPIMASVSNKIYSDKEFQKQYGETTTFSYGCEPNGNKTYYGNDDMGAFELPLPHPQSDCYVYRMTMTNEDGDVVEYTPDFMRYRCEQMGVKCVPAFIKFIVSPITVAAHNFDDIGEYIRFIAECYYDGPDPIGKTHVREGVVVRIVNRPKFCAYKHKNFAFKVLEGIAKDLAEVPDMEEAEELNDAE